MGPWGVDGLWGGRSMWDEALHGPVVKRWTLIAQTIPQSLMWMDWAAHAYLLHDLLNGEVEQQRVAVRSRQLVDELAAAGVGQQAIQPGQHLGLGLDGGGDRMPTVRAMGCEELRMQHQQRHEKSWRKAGAAWTACAAGMAAGGHAAAADGATRIRCTAGAASGGRGESMTRQQGLHRGLCVRVWRNAPALVAQQPSAVPLMRPQRASSTINSAVVLSAPCERPTPCLPGSGTRPQTCPR